MPEVHVAPHWNAPFLGEGRGGLCPLPILHRHRTIVLLRLGIHQLEHTLGTHRCIQHGVDLLRHMADGLCKTLVQLQEGNNRTERDCELPSTNVVTAQCYRRTHHGNQHIAQLSQVTVHRHHDTRDAIRVACRRSQLLVDALEVVNGLLLVTERLHHLLTRHHLLDEAVHAGQRLLLRAEVAARPLAKPCGGYRHQHGDEDAHTRQRNAQHHHRRERHDNRNQRVEHLRHARRDHLSQRVHIVRIGRHQLAMRVGVEVAQRQTLHALKELLAQPQLRALRHVDHQPVVGVRTCHTQQQNQSELQQRLQQRIVRRRAQWCRHACRPRRRHEWHDVVVDERTCEQRRCQRGHRRDGDAHQHREHHPLIVLHHQPQQSDQCRPLLLVYLLEPRLCAWSPMIPVEIRLSHK